MDYDYFTDLKSITKTVLSEDFKEILYTNLKNYTEWEYLTNKNDIPEIILKIYRSAVLVDLLIISDNIDMGEKLIFLTKENFIKVDKIKEDKFGLIDDLINKNKNKNILNFKTDIESNLFLKKFVVLGLKTYYDLNDFCFSDETVNENLINKIKNDMEIFYQEIKDFSKIAASYSDDKSSNFQKYIKIGNKVLEDLSNQLKDLENIKFLKEIEVSSNIIDKVIKEQEKLFEHRKENYFFTHSYKDMMMKMEKVDFKGVDFEKSLCFYKIVTKISGEAYRDISINIKNNLIKNITDNLTFEKLQDVKKLCNNYGLLDLTSSIKKVFSKKMFLQDNHKTDFVVKYEKSVIMNSDYLEYSLNIQEEDEYNDKVDTDIFLSNINENIKCSNINEGGINKYKVTFSDENPKIEKVDIVNYLIALSECDNLTYENAAKIYKEFKLINLISIKEKKDLKVKL